jgi:hypothetical protein
MQLVLNKEILLLLLLCLLVLLDEQLRRRMVLRLYQRVGHSNGRHGPVCVAVHLPIVHLNQRHKKVTFDRKSPNTKLLKICFSKYASQKEYITRKSPKNFPS